MITSRSITPETPEDLLDLSFLDVDMLFKTGEIIKEGKSQNVNLCQIKDKKLIVKSYIARGILAASRLLVRLSRPHKSLRYSYFLRTHGVPCPAHFLVVVRWSLTSAQAYLVIEHVVGRKLSDFLYSKNPPPLTKETAQATINTIKALHSQGLTHGDLHTQNLILKDESNVSLIDLDNVRKTSNNKHKDLDRFRASVKKGKQNTKILLEKINAQL